MPRITAHFDFKYANELINKYENVSGISTAYEKIHTYKTLLYLNYTQGPALGQISIEKHRQFLGEYEKKCCYVPIRASMGLKYFKTKSPHLGIL